MVFIFQRHALHSNSSRQSQTSKKAQVETLGPWGIGPIIFQLIQLASYDIISLCPYSFQYVRHRQKDNTIKSSLFSVIWVWILILISGVFQIVLHLEWYLSDFLQNQNRQFFDNHFDTLNRQEYLEEQDHYSWYIIAIVTLSVKAVTIIFLAIILAADSVLPKTTIGEGQKKCNVMIIVTFCLMYLATALPIVSIILTYIQNFNL